MITVRLNTAAFKKDMNNLINYSEGFLEGINKGKNVFLNNIGIKTKEILEAFIDSNARSNPDALHHIYEWHQTGSPDARLYDIKYTVSNLGLSFYASFKQSTSIKDGSNVPFYNKAKIMEEGISVTIAPVRSSVLVFEDSGDTIFTKSPVTVSNPGGDRVKGSFNKVIDMFFSKYYTQAFLKTSGVYEYLKKPQAYKRNLAAGKKLGRSAGISTGYSWIIKAGTK
jgi:hypothetical protein